MSYRSELHGLDSNGDRLPTADEVLAWGAMELENARRALDDAAGWLRSDWQPVGSLLTKEQGARRRAMRRAIQTAKDAINEAQR